MKGVKKLSKRRKISKMQRSCLGANRLETIKDIHLAAVSTPVKKGPLARRVPSANGQLGRMTKGAARCYPGECWRF